MIFMWHTVILWSAHCDMWSAQNSEFNIAAHVSSKLSKHISQHVFSSISFLYIVVLHQFQLVELSRFQYYLNYDCTFDLFYNIEVYSYKILYSYLNKLSAVVWLKSTFQCTFQSSVYQALSTESFFYDLYSTIHHVMKSKILLLSLLHNMSRDLLQFLKSSFNMTVFAH